VLHLIVIVIVVLTSLIHFTPMIEAIYFSETSFPVRATRHLSKKAAFFIFRDVSYNGLACLLEISKGFIPFTFPD
jgi:capsule polysaccharide export protein KpsE/RkpR